MFGALRKKLQQAISKLTGREEAKELPAEKAEEKIEEKLEEKIEEKPEQILQEEEKPLIEEPEKYLEKEKERLKREEPGKDIPEEKEELEEKKEAVKEELKPEPLLEKTRRAEEERKPKPEPIIEKKAEPVLESREPEKKGFLAGLVGKVTKKITEKELGEEELDRFLSELQMALLENDVALETAEKICADVKANLAGRSVKRGSVEREIKSALKAAVLGVMQQPGISIEEYVEKKSGQSREPFLVVFFGFNGTGKTTTIAKLANRLKRYRPVLAAGDTFRAASIEQLEEHGRRLGLDVVKHKYGADSAAVIFDAVKHASAVGSKVVLADTAGRSHSNANLMDELKKIVRVNKPDMRILVLDSITGNDIYDQSLLFEKAAGVDGIILTKADVYQKGGAALSATHTTKKPVLFLGVGQEYDDLKEFRPEEIAENLLD